MSLVSMNKTEKNTVVLELEVGKDEFQKAVNDAYRKNAGKIQIPGFRKGKAPKAMIEKLYGTAFFYEDAVNALYPEEYEKAVEENGIEPVDKASIDVTAVDDDGFQFTATVTVKPEVKLGKYKGLKAEKVMEAVAAEEIDAEIEKVRQQNSRLIDVTDRVAQLDDLSVIDYEGFVDDVAFDGGKGENQSLKLGSGQFIPGFEEQIVGKSIGDEFDVNVTFPEEYHSEDLKGKSAIFKVKLNGLKYSEVPELDDEFVKDVSEFDTLDEYRADIGAKIQEKKDKTAQNETEDNLMQQVIDDMEVEIPEVMYDHEIDGMVQDFAYRMQSQGLNMETYMQITGMDMDKFREGFKEQAEKKVKFRLALEALVAAEGITASEEDVSAEFEKLAAQYEMGVEDIKKYIPAEQLHQDLAMNKAIDLIRESAEIKEVEKKEVKEEPKEDAKKPAAEKKPAAKKPAAKKPAAKKKTEDTAE